MDSHRENDVGRQRQRQKGCVYKPRSAKECQEPPEARKRQEKISPRVFSENVTAGPFTSDF